MEIKAFTLDHNNIERLSKLLTAVSALDMDIYGYGEIALNENSDNLYVWCEDYSFTLFVDEDGDVKVLYSCSYCGHEFIMDVENDTTLDDINDWVESLDRNDGEHCEECEVVDDEE